VSRAEGPGRAAIVRFVRETLGCGCPDEVFEQTSDSGPGELRRIALGGRLLVYLIRPTEAGLTADRLGDYLSRGRGERDALGFNRVRLVIADEAATEREDLQAAFEDLRAGDERLHLHIVPAAALPGT